MLSDAQQLVRLRLCQLWHVAKHALFKEPEARSRTSGYAGTGKRSCLDPSRLGNCAPTEWVDRLYVSNIFHLLTLFQLIRGPGLYQCRQTCIFMNPPCVMASRN